MACHFRLVRGERLVSHEEHVDVIHIFSFGSSGTPKEVVSLGIFRVLAHQIFVNLQRLLGELFDRLGDVNLYLSIFLSIFQRRVGLELLLVRLIWRVNVAEIAVRRSFSLIIVASKARGRSSEQTAASSLEVESVEVCLEHSIVVVLLALGESLVRLDWTLVEGVEVHGWRLFGRLVI